LYLLTLPIVIKNTNESKSKETYLDCNILNNVVNQRVLVTFEYLNNCFSVCNMRNK